ncbi:cytidine deaminase [Flexibacterium corallicola]|uniref:cytidine deaminase n=1 Tax=Flexibacterium corallicola TaxID=3037259 RepID=UPI00286EFD31|nr:cytidine deaminase [Pseudovibrio sp. M1P-2-3]
MSNEIEQSLFKAAIQLIERRYPIGWGGAAAIRTASGKILTSVAPDTKNDGLSLCMEVGSILEAHKLDEDVTHSLCICRESEHEPYLILTPCGICQERLVHWGGGVMAAISNADNKLVFKSLRELQPHHWSIVNGKAL